jgi:hypothetical protein
MKQALDLLRPSKGQGYAADLSGPPVWVWRWILLVVIVAMVLRVVVKYVGG